LRVNALPTEDIFDYSSHKKMNCFFDIKYLNCEVKSMVFSVFYRSGNTLRFPRACDEPPHSQRTLAVGSHRLRFPAGVFVYFLRCCSTYLFLIIVIAYTMVV